jgi:adenosylmethionine-8-amino-7-oxononanoate aminotransferase
MTGSVFYRSPGHTYPVGVRGEGVYLFDSTGKKYLDGSGGAAVSCLGYGNTTVVDAIREQVSSLAFAHTAFFTNEPQETLAAGLAARFGEAGAKVYCTAGGSEANETAIKLAKQYWMAKGQPSKSVFISRNQSYHGNTLGALSLSGSPGRRAIYQSIIGDWPKIDPCYAYRLQRENESAEEYGARAANELEQAIVAAGAENVAAFFAETVSGATLGAVTAAPGYFGRIREICDRYDVLLVLDEVMSGSGRTGSYFAFEQEGIRPDIVTLAKSLGGGYQPLGATVCRDFLHAAIVEAYGAFAHGHTYVGHATACAAGVAVQSVLDRENLLANVVTRGRQLRQLLRATFEQHPYVGDVRGRGLFVGIELVREKAAKLPPPAEMGLPAWLKNRAMEEGLICYPGGGTVDGRNGVHILLAPPFIYTEANVEELVAKLDRILGDLKLD